MRFVRVFLLGKDRRLHEVGMIHSNGRELSWTPGVRVIASMVSDPVTVMLGGKMTQFTAAQPDAFLDHLHRQYLGTYCQVSPPEGFAGQEEEVAKSLKGGSGSGNFGHEGRPGE